MPSTAFHTGESNTNRKSPALHSSGGRGQEQRKEKGAREGGAAILDNEKKRIRKNEVENAGWVCLKWGDRKGLVVKVTFEENPDRGEGASHQDTRKVKCCRKRMVISSPLLLLLLRLLSGPFPCFPSFEGQES